MKEQVQELRKFNNSDGTRSYAFRQQQLQKLKASILQHEKKLNEALYSELKKSTEESWVTEIGFLIGEIKHTLKHLHSRMNLKKLLPI